MGEKLLPRLLDDVEGEVWFDGARTRLLILRLKELGGLWNSESHWTSALFFLLCACTGLLDWFEGRKHIGGCERRGAGY